VSDFSAWIGRTEEREDRLDPARSNALLAALGRDGTVGEGDPLPPLHHWLHFWDVRRPDETGPDGHPKRGGFLPPVALPRRMWAGGRLIFRAPLRLGERVRRVSTIQSIERKTGRSGELVFVTLSHALSGSEGLAIEEEQDLVYREDSSGALPAQAQAQETNDPAESLLPDPILLFRYSALTMNSHRIHYDRPHATEVEHYPGLVVHGPLQATLLAALAERMLGTPLSTFRFRGVAAALAGERLDLHAAPAEKGLDLWTSHGGVRRMIATAQK
jgi:3-methylfumaryl-CoA hydratase